MTETQPTITKFNLDTRYSINNSVSNPVWTIPKQIDQITGYISGAFNGVNNITNIRDVNKNISVTTWSGTTGTTNILSIPEGNYTSSTFKDTLENTLATTGNTFIIDTNTMGNTFTISSSGGSFSLNNCLNDVYYELGVDATQLNHTQNSLLCSNSFDLSGLKKIDIVSDSLGAASAKKLGSTYNVVLSIPVDSPYGGIIYTPESNIKVSTECYNFNNIALTLFDERMRPINKLSDWSFDLYVESQ